MNEDQPVGELHLDSLDEKKFKHEEVPRSSLLVSTKLLLLENTTRTS